MQLDQGIIRWTLIAPGVDDIQISPGGDVGVGSRAARQWEIGERQNNGDRTTSEQEQLSVWRCSSAARTGGRTGEHANRGLWAKCGTGGAAGEA